MSKKNEDYFTCPQANKLIAEIKDKTFRDVEQMRDFLDKLNKRSGGECWIGLVWNGKAQYPQLKCIYRECPYNHWFK